METSLISLVVVSSDFNFRSSPFNRVLFLYSLGISQDSLDILSSSQSAIFEVIFSFEFWFCNRGVSRTHHRVHIEFASFVIVMVVRYYAQHEWSGVLNAFELLIYAEKV